MSLASDSGCLGETHLPNPFETMREGGLTFKTVLNVLRQAKPKFGASAVVGESLRL